jgi:hypothetical protein
MTSTDDDIVDEAILASLFTNHIPPPPAELAGPPPAGALARRLRRRRLAAASVAAGCCLALAGGAVAAFPLGHGGGAATLAVTSPTEQAQLVDPPEGLALWGPVILDRTGKRLTVDIEHRACDRWTLGVIETATAVRFTLVGTVTTPPCKETRRDPQSVQLRRPLGSRRVGDLGQALGVLDERQRLHPSYLPHPHDAPSRDFLTGQSTSPTSPRGAGWVAHYLEPDNTSAISVYQCFGRPADCQSQLGPLPHNIGTTTVHGRPAEILKRQGDITIGANPLSAVTIRWAENGYTFAVTATSNPYNQQTLTSQAQLVANGLR